MKKKIITIFTIAILITIIFYLQFCREEEVYNTNIESFKNGYCEHVNVIANKLIILDKEKFAEEAISKCINNTYKGIMFSYDIKGYPNELTIQVYLSESDLKSGKESFRVYYAQDKKYHYKYNIKENPEKFEMKIQ